MKLLIKSHETKITENLDDKIKAEKTFKLADRMSFRGLDIAIENKKGSTRKGVNDDGTKWETFMNYPYGYIRKTESISDGEKIDCYIGENKESDKVFIVDQNNPFTGKFDEQKIMLGFDSADEAKKAYLKQYDNPKFFGSIKEMPFDEFKKKALATQDKPKVLKAFGRLLKAIGDQLGMFGDAPVNEGDIRLKDGKAYQVKRSVKNPQVKRIFRVDEPGKVHDKKEANQLSIFGKKVGGEEKPKEPIKPAPKPEPGKKNIAPEPKAEKKIKDIPNLFDQPEEVKSDPEKDKESGLDDFGVSHITKQVRKQRIEINKKVRELLDTKKDEDFTDDDKKLLAQYSGRGGTDEVSLNEYYTPDYVARFQWDMLKKLGVNGGNILEPSCGTGVFLHTAPEDMLITAIEYDETSSRIAGVLFPDHDVHNMSFEKYNAEKFDRGFQGAIGNVPFGVRGMTAADDREKIDLKTHEQYFMDRLIDNLDEGGVASIIVPTGIMDNQINEYRLGLNKKAEFLGAIRMPTGVFEKANAVVTTDILFFRKRPEEVIERLTQLKGDELSKLYDAMVLDADFVAGNFFKNNPEFALGEEAIGQFGMKIRKGRISENDLKKVGELLKDVPEDYSILQDLNLTPKPRTTLNVGDIKQQNGRTYILNKNHRWERLTDEQAEEIVLSEELQKMFGIKSYADLEALKQDWSRHFELSREQLKALDNDYDELDSYTDKDLNSNEKLKQAVVLGLKIKEFQKDLQDGKLDTSDAQREAQKLVMELDNFKEKYGNPLVDKKILKNLGHSPNNPMLYVAGSFDAEGNLSKIYSDPVSFYNVYKTKANIGNLDTENLGSIVNYFYDNNIPASLEMISSSYRGDIGPANIVKELLKDENIFIDEKGNFAPMQEVCMGEVYNKLDYWESRKEENKLKLTKDDISDEEKELAVLENKKLEDQIFELNRKVGTKNLEDLPVSISDAGRFYSMELLNSYLRDRIPNYYMGEIVFDKATNLFTFSSGILAETYNLYASKGANDLDDKKRLQDLLKYHFNKVDNPYMLMVLNKMNNIPLSIRKDRERIEADLTELASGIKTFLSNSDDADKITDSFNRAFNNYIQKEYDSSPIEGIAKFDYDRVIVTDKDGRQVTARDKAGEHTWATVRRMYDQGKGMIAHGVGLGKTLQGILLTLLSKQTGRAKKPLIVTPQSVLINWAGEIDKWTKDVNYIVVGFSKKDKSKGWDGKNIRKDSTEENKLKLLQIMNNDYDMVLMTRDFFTTLEMSPDTKENMIEEMVDKFYPGDESTNKKLKKKREGIRQELAELFLKGMKKDKHGKYIGKTDEVYFENIGFDMIMRDECFPKGTLIDGKPIETIKKGDLVRSFNHKINKIELKKVVNLQVRKAKTLLRIMLANNKQITCTENHPFYTQRGYVFAKDLNQNDYVVLTNKKEGILNAVTINKMFQLSERISANQSAKLENANKGRNKILLQQAMFINLQNDFAECTEQDRSFDSFANSQGSNKEEDVRTQSDVYASQQREDDKFIKGYSIKTNKTGWKRQAISKSTVDVTGKIRARLGIRESCKNWYESFCQKLIRISNALQNRYSPQRIKDWDRDRRQFTQPIIEKSRGHKENELSGIIRVQSIEILKQTGDGTFGGMCTDGFVYNIEVEDNHNYFAENILVHNCHDTKNLLVPLEMDVSGLKGNDAKRSYQHYFVSKLIRNANEGKGVFNLTATPISNSPLEVFNMMLPFAEQELEKMGINTMDDFIRRFAEIKTVPTTDPDGRVVEKNKFAGWLAPDELRNSFFRFVDYKTYQDVESVKASIKFPREKPNNVLSEMNEGQKELMKHCQKRLWVMKYSRVDKDKGARILDRERLGEAVQAGIVTPEDSELIINHYTNEYLPLYNNLNFHRDPEEKPIDDGYFQIQSDMIKITSDLDWYKEINSNFAKKVEDNFVDQYRGLPKFNDVIDNVTTLHKQGQKQLIFAINVKLHDKIFKQLIDAGIPADEIKIVNGKTVKGKDRKQVSDDFNSGKYKIIIGNYATMGEGLNFNNGTSDIHHIQPAWNYLQIEQGNGRAIRQGNWQDFVNTHYYLSKGSIDSFMNQKIMDKGKMVDQFLKGEKSTWDDEAQLAAEEMMIALSDNPEVAKKILEQQNKNLQQAVEAKEKANNFRNFDKLYDMKNRLSKTEDKESRQYKTLSEEIEKTQNQLNNSKNFEHKDLLNLDQKPIILPGNNAIIPVGSVMSYGYDDDTNSFAIIDDYAPSAGKITVTVWTPEKTERKKIDIKLFSSQYDQTIKHSGFDTEEMFNKIIKDGEMSSSEMFYKLPADTLKKHKKDIIKNLRDTTERVLYRDKDNNIKADYADDAVQEIDNEGGRFIFPQEDDEFEKFLFQSLKVEESKRGRLRDDYWHIKQIAEKMYGYEYLKVLENKFKKKKGEAVTEDLEMAEA